MNIQKKIGKIVAEIAEQLKKRRYIEKNIERNVFEPILQALGWNTSDFMYQYSVGEGRVDYALFHTVGDSRHLRIFAEIKAPGMIKPESEKQLFEYALYESPPILILTDGKEWNFYLTARQGKPDDRKFCKLNIIEQSPEESADILCKCLLKEIVSSGEAIENARIMGAEKDIIKSWHSLLSASHKKLPALLTKEFEHIFGYKPSDAIVENFLHSKVNDTITTPLRHNINERKPRNISKSKTPNKSVKSKITGFTYKGKFHKKSTMRDILQSTLILFSKEDKKFLSKLKTSPKYEGLISRDIQELYKLRTWLKRDKSSIREIQTNNETWFFVVNFSAKGIETRLQICCKVANISFGKDFKIIYE